ncbi:mitogen-activated protein kinase kinase kinase 18-like [Aristolochia californica]|uniref:mitogen-activated protein kinase kinase kinase 18-like n=1 Tax=Aristolochia californica TaxID=171875 RepID=UPI0035DC4E5F
MSYWIRGPTIGRGSSATVSVAVAGEEMLAVKSAELARSRFLLREQRILSLLASPRIVRYVGHDITAENGETFFNLMMEYIEGGSLSDLIKLRGGRLEESEIRSVTRGILQGLSYLHGKRLVHCDIKGQNILMGLDGPKIADLGCARWFDGSASDQPIAGTPLYMAPEVARCEAQGFPADLWALGCTVIEMATGRAPWPDAVDPVSALYRIAYSADVPEFPSCFSDQATDFLNKCLRRNPEERWTVDQLIKHPFVDDFSKQFMESSISTNSPTSILDQGFWDSLDESETEFSLTHFESKIPQYTDERLRRLSGANSPGGSPDWTWGEDWITVRGKGEAEISSSGTEVDQIPTDDQISGSNFIWHIEEELEASSCSVFINEEKLEMEPSTPCYVPVYENIPSESLENSTTSVDTSTIVILFSWNCVPRSSVILYCSCTKNNSFFSNKSNNSVSPNLNCNSTPFYFPFYIEILPPLTMLAI